MKRYPKYKDSGVEWLGKVPEHWEVRRFKYLLRERDVRSLDGAEQLLRVSQFTGVTERRRADGDSEPDTRAASLVGYKVVEPEELVVNIMLAWNGSMGVSRFSGIASPAYCVYRFDAAANPWYFHYLLRSPAYKARIKAISTGVVESRLRLYSDELYRLEGLLPSLPEQDAIVRFLNHADRRIGRYIRAKQKLIQLLDEQKQAIIHGAVTRGLDPDVRLKPSGVEWLGDVPEHWVVMRLRHLIEGRLTYGANAAAEHTNADWPRYLRITDFAVDGSLRADTFRSLPLEMAREYLVRPGDLLLARSGATVGKAFLVPTGLGPACHAGYLIRARPQRRLIDPEYLFAFTQSAGFARWKDSTFIIATIQNIGADKYADLPVPVPPIPEQCDIVLHLRKAVAETSAAIDRASHEINLLREYRTRLIDDVVTGKLDVRDAVARLPVDAAGSELSDEAIAETDGYEVAANDTDELPDEAEA